LLVCGVVGMYICTKDIQTSCLGEEKRNRRRRRDQESELMINMKKKTEGEEMQEPKEAGVGSAVGQAMSDLKPVGGSQRAQGAECLEFQRGAGRRYTTRDTGCSVTWHFDGGRWMINWAMGLTN